MNVFFQSYCYYYSSSEGGKVLFKTDVFFKLRKLFSLFVGKIGVSDPNAHLKLTTRLVQKFRLCQVDALFVFYEMLMQSILCSYVLT